MTARKKCCKYCEHSGFYGTGWICGKKQQYVKPMSVCEHYCEPIDWEEFEFIQIED